MGRLSKERPFPIQMDVIQFVEALNRTVMQRKGKFALCLSWDINLLLFLDIGSPDSWTFGLGLTYTIDFPGPRAFEFKLELYHQLSWASSLQIADGETSQSP